MKFSLKLGKSLENLIVTIPGVVESSLHAARFAVDVVVVEDDLASPPLRVPLVQLVQGHAEAAVQLPPGPGIQRGTILSISSRYCKTC